MKHLLALLMALCIAALPCLCAGAETDAGALRVIDGWLSAEEYQKAYPDRAIEKVDTNEETNGNRSRRELLFSGDWDAAYICTDEDSLAELEQAGLLLHLDAYENVAALANDMYPTIRAAGTLNGKLAALPVCFIGSLASPVALLGAERYYDDFAKVHLQALGMTADDQPTTFSELCALGVRYMEQSREARKGTTFYYTEASPMLCILNDLVRQYSMQYVDDERRVNFDTDVFRAALEQADALNAALQTDPTITYDADGSCHTFICSLSNSLISSGTYLQLRAGDKTIPAFTEMVIVNPNSKHINEAIDYLLIAARQSETQFAPVLYQHVDYDALVRQSYDEDIAAQIEEGEDQSVIDNLVALRDAGDPRYYLYTREEIERYQTEVAPYLVFPRAVYVGSDDASSKYLSGKLDADGYIAALNDAAAQAREQ